MFPLLVVCSLPSACFKMTLQNGSTGGNQCFLGRAEGGRACLSDLPPRLFTRAFFPRRQGNPSNINTGWAPSPFGLVQLMALRPRTAARWQRWRTDGNALTLISSSQRACWCIDCRTDQLETFWSPRFGGAERQWAEFYRNKSQSQGTHSFSF